MKRTKTFNEKNENLFRSAALQRYKGTEQCARCGWHFMPDMLFTKKYTKDKFCEDCFVLVNSTDVFVKVNKHGKEEQQI